MSSTGDSIAHTKGVRGSAQQAVMLVAPHDEAAIRNASAVKITAVAFTLAAVYATVRYNVMNNVSWADWPVFILNKIVAVTSLELLVFVVARHYLSRAKFNGKILFYSGVLAMLHSFVSIILISPLYFPKLFEDGKLTFSAALSLVMGIAVILAFFMGRKRDTSKSIEERLWTLALITFFSGVHAGLIGFKGWFEPQHWPGKMPPLTLISFLLGAVAFVVALWCRSSFRQRQLIKI